MEKAITGFNPLSLRANNVEIDALMSSLGVFGSGSMVRAPLTLSFECISHVVSLCELLCSRDIAFALVGHNDEGSVLGDGSGVGCTKGRGKGKTKEKKGKKGGHEDSIPRQIHVASFLCARYLG